MFDYLQFPVCSPALARSRARPLRAMRDLRGAGWMRLSHYDQVIEAARKGSGVAIGKWPHLADHLREGQLVAALGPTAEARVGGFFLEVADGAPADSVTAFVAWLRQEAAASEQWRAAWDGAKKTRDTKRCASARLVVEPTREV